VIYGLDLTVGVEHAFGSEETKRGFQFMDDIIGYVPETTTVYRDWKMIVGFSFTL
jgi:hypothetical protein